MSLLRVSFAILICVLISGCGLKRSSHPNVLILTVEGLGFDRVACQSESLTEGFVTLCQESVRFTHAYTNSTGSVANMATILTGLLPWEHGLRGHTQWLRPHREAIAERALEKGYRTAFISSGLPFFSKTGLGQGFENFDDRVDLFQRPRFRSAGKVVDHFLNWFDEGGSSRPFFSVLHFSDMLYPFESSSTKEGEPRELSVASQMEEISEELGRLFQVLKDEGYWNNTYVVLTGLGGGGDLSNIKSSQTQIALMIKPQRVKRDQGTSWGVDLNVSLVDLGVSLIEVIGDQIPERWLEDRTSLSSVYTRPSPNWSRDRLILTEMYWAFENFGEKILRAARSNHLFYIHSDPPLLYNTLTDRQELNPLPMTDNIYALNFDSFREFIEKSYERSPRPQVPDWFYAGVEGFRKGIWDTIDKEDLKQNPSRSWMMRWWFEKKEYEKLLDEFDEDLLLQYVVLSKTNKNLVSPGIIRDLSCSEAFLTSSLLEVSNLRENCDQDRLLRYVDWAKSKNTNEELFYENRFRRSFQFWWSRLELGAMNYAAFGSLGLPLSWPYPPDTSELFLIHRERKNHRVLMTGFTSTGKYQ